MKMGFVLARGRWSAKFDPTDVVTNVATVNNIETRLLNAFLIGASSTTHAPSACRILTPAEWQCAIDCPPWRITTSTRRAPNVGTRRFSAPARMALSTCHSISRSSHPVKMPARIFEVVCEDYAVDQDQYLREHRDRELPLSTSAIRQASRNSHRSSRVRNEISSCDRA